MKENKGRANFFRQPLFCRKACSKKHTSEYQNLPREITKSLKVLKVSQQFLSSSHNLWQVADKLKPGCVIKVSLHFSWHFLKSRCARTLNVVFTYYLWLFFSRTFYLQSLFSLALVTSPPRMVTWYDGGLPSFTRDFVQPIEGLRFLYCFWVRLYLLAVRESKLTA